MKKLLVTRVVCGVELEAGNAETLSNNSTLTLIIEKWLAIQTVCDVEWEAGNAEKLSNNSTLTLIMNKLPFIVGLLD